MTAKLIKLSRRTSLQELISNMPLEELTLLRKPPAERTNVMQEAGTGTLSVA